MADFDGITDIVDLSGNGKGIALNVMPEPRGALILNGRTLNELNAGIVAVDSFYDEFDIRRYEADMTGVENADTAWADWLRVLYTLANRTGETGLGTTYGLGTVTIPKGKLKLTQSYVAPGTALGLKIKGAGIFATSVEFHNDSAVMFSQAIYNNFGFEDIAFVHVPQNPDPTTWTNRWIELNGLGGGRKFYLNRVRTKNFFQCIKNLSTVNEDTFLIQHSEFYDFEEDFFFSRSSQALSNMYLNNTWKGRGKSILNYAGMGHTIIEGGVSLIDGAWLKPSGEAGKWGTTAIISLFNFKGEFHNWAGKPGGSTSAVIAPHGDWTTFQHRVKLYDCGLTGGVAIDPTSFQIETNPGIGLEWYGGQLNYLSNIRTRSAGMLGRSRHLWFEGLSECPLPTRVNKDNTVVGGQQSITFKRCVELPGTTRITNITLDNLVAGREPITLEEPEQDNYIAPNVGNAQTILAINGVYEQFNLPFYAHQQTIKELTISFTNKGIGTGNVTFEIFSNAARTNLIDTITFTNAETGNISKSSAAIVGQRYSDGIYIRSTGTTTHYGRIFCRHRAG
jgi:hypothetical protein